MKFNRLKPFLVLTVLAIVLASIFYYLDANKQACKINKDDQSFSDIKDRFELFLNGKTGFKSIDHCNSSYLIDSLFLTQTKRKKQLDLLFDKCLDKQINFLERNCDHQDIKTLVNDYSECLYPGDLRGFRANNILDCIEYKNKRFTAELNQFTQSCQKQARLAMNEDIWQGFNNKPVFSIIKKYNTCMCCINLSLELKKVLEIYREKNRNYENSYKYIEDLTDNNFISEDPIIKKFTDVAKVNELIKSIPVNTHYHKMFITLTSEYDYINYP